MKKRGWVEVMPNRHGRYEVWDWSEHEDSGSTIREGVSLGVALQAALAHQQSNLHRKLRIFGEEEDGS